MLVSCISSLSTIGPFKGSLQKLIPGFVTAKRKLISHEILPQTENAFSWRVTRWMSLILEFESLFHHLKFVILSRERL